MESDSDSESDSDLLSMKFKQDFILRCFRFLVNLVKFLDSSDELLFDYFVLYLFDEVCNMFYPILLLIYYLWLIYFVFIYLLHNDDFRRLRFINRPLIRLLSCILLRSLHEEPRYSYEDVN